MVYIAIEDFADLQDSTRTKTGPIYHIYHKGDVFPRDGKSVSDSRIRELATNTNAQGKPLIKPLGNKSPEVSPEKRVEELSEKLTKKELLDVANEHGLKIPAKATKAEIVELIQSEVANNND